MGSRPKLMLRLQVKARLPTTGSRLLASPTVIPMDKSRSVDFVRVCSPAVSDAVYLIDLLLGSDSWLGASNPLDTIQKDIIQSEFVKFYNHRHLAPADGVTHPRSVRQTHS